MANDSTSGPKRMEVSDLVFGAGWVSYLVALDMATSQGAVNALNGLAAALMGASAGMAWQSGRPGRAALFGALAVVRAVLGPPTVSPHSSLHIAAAWIIIGLWVVAVMITFARRRRHDASAAPIAG